ncbi:MAG: tRNA preQ1(34) S-adenosylmethionine ribosyltransferase-isomerase QueA [Acidobacteria bacterium]|nr:tRNA preQ1(34) S-adenosylmethionine ribosyltransferase-isomerase QueA [Acidobacteriota bacterium]MBS1864552.1 tRNA preQ1(34) S-adenosylmethionine ribosyltransferase-isomerase QueA [Acidobacteriota bacterium]
MHLADLDYRLPPELIAQRPLERRDASRMLVLSRLQGAIEDCQFADLPALLRGDELLVYNNAKVIPARLFGKRKGLHSQAPSRSEKNEHLRGEVEVFLAKYIDTTVWECLVRPGRKLPVGETILFGNGELQGEILSRGELGLRTVRFSATGEETVGTLLEKLGHVPLPPYIEREDESLDRSRYQTIFASQPGAVAAPTAGLHFTPEALDRIRARGAETCELTLDVGLGTFQPIHTDDLKDHVMHAESYEISEETVHKITSARRMGRKILAVGTTVVRALEASALREVESGTGELLAPGKAEARLFITPGFDFRVVDALLTNFHLPRSTLLALVCAFAGRENVLSAYRHAVEAKYRFYSYGDCMLIR